MKVTVLRNPSLGLLKELRLANRSDIAEGETIDVSEAVGNKLVALKLAEQAKVRGIPRAAEITTEK